MNNPFGKLTWDGDAEEAESSVPQSAAPAQRSAPPVEREQGAAAPVAGLRPRPAQAALQEIPGQTAHQQPGRQLRPYAIAVGAACAILILYLLTSAVVGWLGTKADDLEYGRPRTFQLNAYVGHNETPGSPSHFIALNLNHQVDIIEMPGGDVSKARAISGPYLFGDGADLTPVTLEVRDVNGDNKPDLLVNIKNEQVIYINSGTDFHLMTDAERATVGGAK